MWKSVNIISLTRQNRITFRFSHTRILNIMYEYIDFVALAILIKWKIQYVTMQINSNNGNNNNNIGSNNSIESLAVDTDCSKWKVDCNQVSSMDVCQK